MKFYDYCLIAEDGIEAIMKKAIELGWNGLCILNEKKKNLPLKKIDKIDVVRGLLIETNKAKDVGKEAANNRKLFEIIAARGVNEEVNRMAVETPEIDILLPAPDAKIDYVMVKLAKKNNVAIGFEFRLLLQSSGEERGRIFSRMLETAKLVKKFRAPFVLTSGAMSDWDLRSPSELYSFGKVLGFDPSGIRTNLSDKIVEENRKRLGDKWVMPGVEVEE